VERKWPVQPVSAMMDGEGPRMELAMGESIVVRL
jgi:hypothetical protein